MERGSITALKEPLDWIRMVNPINYRRFIQTLGKYHLFNTQEQVVCTENNYPQGDFEKLVDSYGLLLYRTYNTNGNGPIQEKQNLSILEKNRVKTNLILKKYLNLDKREGKFSAFIIDKQKDILSAVDTFKAKGQITGLSPQIDESLGHNNGNGKISPGEVVGGGH